MSWDALISVKPIYQSNRPPCHCSPKWLLWVSQEPNFDIFPYFHFGTTSLSHFPQKPRLASEFWNGRPAWWWEGSHNVMPSMWSTMKVWLSNSNRIFSGMTSSCRPTYCGWYMTSLVNLFLILHSWLRTVGRPNCQNAASSIRECWPSSSQHFFPRAIPKIWMSSWPFDCKRAFYLFRNQRLNMPILW